MYRERNLDRQQLRDKFFQVALGEEWFEPPSLRDEERTASFAASAAAASSSSSSIPIDRERDRDRSHEANLYEKISSLFGPPPYEFLEPGDSVPRYIINQASGQPISLIRDDRRDPRRQGHVSYASVGHSVQFVDSLDRDKERHYWLPNSTELVNQAETSEELYEALDRLQRDDGELRLNYRRPIHSHRKSEVEAPRVGDLLTLYSKGKRRRDSTVPPSFQAVVVAVFVQPKRATGNVYVQAKRPGE